MEARLGFVVRRVLLPVFLGVAALHTDLREIGLGDGLGPALAIIVAVMAIKLAVGYPAARLAGFDAGEARAIGALLQCGGIMTIAISLDVLQAGVIGLRLHATLTLVGLVSTLVAGPLLARARLGERGRPGAGARRLSHAPGAIPTIFGPADRPLGWGASAPDRATRRLRPAASPGGRECHVNPGDTHSGDVVVQR